ncbi:MAG TPA: DUF1353 domain-containing protein [Pseudonocardiaceae bacterium]
MIGFESNRPVAITQDNDLVFNAWRTLGRLVYHCADGTIIEVEIGQDTDLTSSPAVLRWLVDVLTGTAAAILHDHLWRRVVPTGLISYRRADHILLEALGTLGVAAPRRYLMFAAVRWGSLLTRRGGHIGWWRDAPLVLAITIPGLLLVAPAILLLIPLSLLSAADYMATTMHNKERRR